MRRCEVRGKRQLAEICRDLPGRERASWDPRPAAGEKILKARHPCRHYIAGGKQTCMMMTMNYTTAGVVELLLGDDTRDP